MPNYEITSPDGRAFQITAPEGASQEQVLSYAQQHHAETAPMQQADNTGTWQKFGQPFVNTAKQGVSDLGDFLSFGTSYGDQHPMQDVLRQKHQAGTADRHDYERAFVEGMSNSPGGKILGAVGGLIPEFNVANTALNTWINPAITKATGIDPTELQLAEMAAPAALAVKGKNVSPQNIPSMKPLGIAADTITYPIRHPLNTIGAAANLAVKPLSAVAKPVVRGIIESDNPITGEPGLKTSLTSDVAQEGTRLGNKLGINFSAGELTGNPTAINIEDALANSGRWGGKFAEANQAKTDALVSNFNKLLDKISPEGRSREDVGDRISSAYNNTINNLIKTRSQQGKVDFEAAYKNAADDGKYIQTNNLFRTLNELKDEGDARLLTPALAEGGTLAKQLLSRLTTKTKAGNTQADTITLKELGNGLSNFSAAARKSGGAFEDAKTAAVRRIYARLNSALEQDLDAELAKPKGDQQRTAMLKAARDNWFGNSQKIADLEKTTIGKMVGGAKHDSEGNLLVSPELIADKFTNMEPSEIRNTLSFLDKNHPDVANSARRYTLESALRAATQGQGLRGEGTTKPFSKAEFVRKLPDRETLNALLKDPSAYNDIVDIASAANRLIDYGAQKKGSQTAQRTDLLHGIANWGKGALFRSVVSDTLAEDLLNPSKRRQMAIEARNGSKE